MKGQYIFQNLNPNGIFVGDCAVRAIAEALNLSWDKAYIELADYGFRMKNLPNSNEVWGACLYAHYFYKQTLPEV